MAKLITFGEWLTQWFEVYKKPNLQPNSVRNIEQMIRLHTPLWLKQMPMVKITPFDVDKALSETPNGRQRAYARQVWHSAFLKACKLGYVVRNVMELADPVKYKKQRSKALTITEQRLFLEALRGKRIEWVMLFYLHTGVRRAEAVALKWQDIDYTENLILIRGTKTADSYRHILLTEPLKLILEEQRKQNERYKPRKGLEIDPARVFPFSCTEMSRAFKRVCPNHHLHELRHTFVTRCAECGININVCQQLVGHSTADMTINVYTHVMDEFKRKEALKFNIFPDFGTKKDE
ncbi:MAG: site-specific integrase [Clostridia bacterium]|nr:site-specific integrase [Clostridia bacterium]